MTRLIPPVLMMLACARAWCLPDFMEGAEPTEWHTLNNSSWVRGAAVGAAPAAMQLVCQSPDGQPLVQIFFHFDEPYSDNARVRFLGTGVDAFEFEPASETGSFQVTPAPSVISLLYGSTDRMVLALGISDGNKTHAYVYPMKGASQAAHRVLETCGALQ